jgi:glutaredoxin
MNEVVLYSRPGCCLCDEVKAQLGRLALTYNFKWSELDISGDPELREHFAERIPVVFINGQQAFEYILDEKEFVRRLGASAPREATTR